MVLKNMRQQFIENNLEILYYITFTIRSRYDFEGDAT